MLSLLECKIVLFWVALARLASLTREHSHTMESEGLNLLLNTLKNSSEHDRYICPVKKLFCASIVWQVIMIILGVITGVAIQRPSLSSSGFSWVFHGETSLPWGRPLQPASPFPAYSSSA